MSSRSSSYGPVAKPLWIDTDPSGLVWTGLDCDDDLAVLVALALQEHHLIDLKGISICGGNAPLQHTWPDIHRLLDHVDIEDTPRPVKGYGWRSMHVAWKSMHFYNFFTPDIPDSEDAAQALVELSQQHALTNNPVNILMLGPPTNLARAIESGALNPAGIDHVYLMGGEMTGQQLDLNFRSDRAAARTVIESELKTTIVTIQTCGQVSVTMPYLDQYFPKETSLSLAAFALLPKMKQQIKAMPKIVNPHVKKRLLVNDDDSVESSSRWKASPNLDFGFVPWDVVALLAITHPEDLFDEWEYHRVAIPPCDKGEPCNKTMLVLEDLGSDASLFESNANWSGLVRVPHRVKNETQFLHTMFSYLAEVPAANPQHPPPLYWGFVNTGIGLAVGTLSVLSWVFF